MADDQNAATADTWVLFAREPSTFHPIYPEQAVRLMKAPQRDQLLQALQSRFENNLNRHQGVIWDHVLAKLQASPVALGRLGAMESSGGEPDVIGFNPSAEQYVFCDCSAESPVGRRSLCYDRAALDSRKEHKPKGNVVETAAAMGIELLTEEQYRALQQLGEFDIKTSSWVATPEDVRSRGGALFCDRRYDRVFVYHNGAQSYYGSRGFRGLLRV